MLRLLDTNTCIYYLNRVSENLIAQFRKYSPSDIKLSSITVAELFFGVEKRKAKKKTGQLLKVLSQLLASSLLMKPAAGHTLKSELLWRKKEAPLALWIYSLHPSAWRTTFILVTNNTKEFSRISKLKLENWL